MKTTHRIPTPKKGWRWLEEDEVVQAGDYFVDHEGANTKAPCILIGEIALRPAMNRTGSITYTVCGYIRKVKKGEKS